MKYSYAEIAAMIDHAVLHPTLTDAELLAQIELAKRYGVASVCLKPYAVPLATEILRGTNTAVCTVIGFPHGSPATEIKRYETQLACAEGATEVDMVVNVGKVLSGDWAFVEADIAAVVEEAHKNGAKAKVIFETDFVTADADKIMLCEICDRVGADWVKTSTGFGYVKGADGTMGYKGATEADLRLLRAHCSPRLQVKASGGIRDLDAVILARDLGCSRVGCTATQAIMDEAKRREASGAGDAANGKLGQGGY
ncbi:MAG: deoxyribose-phosphate aldolase [Armatimonadetes bacterium]|nr:deoxyribose-phosphate aldolase [Armatimonadota bacterium]